MFHFLHNITADHLEPNLPYWDPLLKLYVVGLYWLRIGELPVRNDNWYPALIRCTSCWSFLVGKEDILSFNDICSSNLNFKL